MFPFLAFRPNELIRDSPLGHPQSSAAQTLFSPSQLDVTVNQQSALPKLKTENHSLLDRSCRGRLDSVFVSLSDKPARDCQPGLFVRKPNNPQFYCSILTRSFIV